jgi:hypothetical protein
VGTGARTGGAEGMPSFSGLPAEQLDELVAYLSGLR